VRTIFDLHAMAEAPETRMLVLKKVWPDTVTADNPTTATPDIFAILLQVVTGDVHVRRIQTFWEVMTSLVVPSGEPLKSRAGQATSPKFGVAAE
jgi:hypothetical protein